MGVSRQEGSVYMDDASERAIEEDMLDQFNYFDDEDEELIDRREPAALDTFDLVDEEPDEDEVGSAEPPQPSRLDSLLSRAPMHHGVRAGALHMKTDWHQIVTAGDELAVHSPISHPSSAAPACLCWQAEQVPGACAIP